MATLKTFGLCSNFEAALIASLGQLRTGIGCQGGWPAQATSPPHGPVATWTRPAGGPGHGVGRWEKMCASLKGTNRGVGACMGMHGARYGPPWVRLGGRCCRGAVVGTPNPLRCPGPWDHGDQMSRQANEDSEVMRAPPRWPLDMPAVELVTIPQGWAMEKRQHTSQNTQASLTQHNSWVSAISGQGHADDAHQVPLAAAQANPSTAFWAFHALKSSLPL